MVLNRDDYYKIMNPNILSKISHKQIKEDFNFIHETGKFNGYYVKVYLLYPERAKKLYKTLKDNNTPSADEYFAETKTLQKM